MDKFVLECDCHLRSHVAILERVDDDIVMDFQLAPYLRFWCRVRAALDYVLQRRNTISWDCILISPKQAQELKQFLENKETK